MYSKQFRVGRTRGSTKCEKRRVGAENSGTFEDFKQELFTAIFGTTLNNGRREHNVAPYLGYISRQITEWDVVYKESWESLSIGNTTPSTTADVVAQVLTIFQGLELEIPTIDDVADALCVQHNLEVVTANSFRSTLRHLVFAALGWATMLYTPVPNSSNQHLCMDSPIFTGRDLSSRRCQNINIAGRPVAAMLRAFALGNANRRTISDTSLLPSQEENAGRIQTSNLQCYCLLYICGISVQWIDNLDNHLCFDQSTRVLMLFRFPSFCLVQLQNSGDIILERSLKGVLFGVRTDTF